MAEPVLITNRRGESGVNFGRLVTNRATIFVNHTGSMDVNEVNISTLQWLDKTELRTE